MESNRTEQAEMRPAREKFWNELLLEEKVERARTALLQIENILDHTTKMAANAYETAKCHGHDEVAPGKVVMPVIERSVGNAAIFGEMRWDLRHVFERLKDDPSLYAGTGYAASLRQFDRKG